MKRFTETTKWSDPWYQDLTPEMKLLWNYLCDSCDSSGVWKVNKRLASFQLGFDFELKAVLELFGKRIHILTPEKWFLISFVKFQYGELSEDCRPHKPILDLVKTHGLEKVLKGYQRGISTPNTIQEQEKDNTKIRKDRPQSQIEVEEFCASIGLPRSDGDATWNKWQGNGFTNGGKKIADWKATIRSWKAAGHMPSQKQAANSAFSFSKPIVQPKPSKPTEFQLQIGVAKLFLSEPSNLSIEEQNASQAFLRTINPDCYRAYFTDGEIEKIAWMKL